MNKITKFFIFALIISFSNSAVGQDSRTITTAVPFLTIAPDARAGAMGDAGAVSTPDVYSQYWNASKYVFNESNSGIGISYTPWLNSLVSDIFLGNVSGFYKIDDRSAIGASLKYFSLGEIQGTGSGGENTWLYKPNEFSFDISYALKLDDNFSMAVALRYIQSDLNGGASDPGTKVGRSVGVDISGYYFTDEKKYENFDGKFTFGWNVSNIGPKMNYTDDIVQENFLPTNLRLGVGYNFKFDSYNELNVMLDLNKLLVPTPPMYYQNGEEMPDGSISDGSTAPANIKSGKDPNVGVVTGMVQSFYDAPGGFSEEMDEIAYAFGAEYVYDKTFALRTGYFHENETKGARQYATIGFGFMYNSIGLDFSYLISTSQVKSPLENTLRFSLVIDLGSFNVVGDDIE